MYRRSALFAFLLLLVSHLPAAAQAPVEYRLSFADHVHHVMDVEITFRDVTVDPLEIRMSRTSPGRYALHEFAKNVFDVRVSDGNGRPLPVEQPDLHGWTVRGHGGTVRIQYRLFGDRVDGTYAGIDADHAHLNVPATLMWARSMEGRPATVRLEPPPGVEWKVATQLFPTADPYTFTAPNLAYLLDSPIQLSPHTLRTFEVGANGSRATIRLALHHDGTDAEADAYARDLEKIVHEQAAIFGELPAFETGTYTFMATYRPGASGDGMEHRNSTILTAGGSLASNRAGLLGTASHEFFHAWNVERIRPRSLEPFDFEKANVSGELWLAEGFTSYYGPLTLARAGLQTFDRTVAQFEGLVNAVVLAPGRAFRSAVDMSRLAPFVDAACSIDPTNWENTFLSYYTFGAALGLGLDLALRDRTDNRVSLDDYMRALWQRFGRTPSEPGVVATPYTMADLRTVLADVSGDPAFAEDFFRRYVEGREMMDYAPLLARAGLVLRPRAPKAPYIGHLALTPSGDGARVTESPRMGTPVYEAGIGEGDTLLRLGDVRIGSDADVEKALASAAPGQTITARIRRHGKERDVTILVTADPRLELVPVERAGGQLTPAQKRFRGSWLGSRRGIVG
ncbi:MAG TPA: PDZ domain-containing protein [Vicinamibacterales bacterium]